MKRFILLSSGRAGSTSFIDTLARYNDIAVPGKQIDCVDNEIFHPRNISRYMQEYQTLTGQLVNDELSLIEAFYHSNNKFPYAGFKSMPNRHKSLQDLVTSENIKIITLAREDIASTVASFIVAIDRNTWRRHGGKQKYRFTYGLKYSERVISHLAYIIESMKVFQSIPDAIHLKFEDICRSDFSNNELDEFFQRPVKLHKPKPPVSAKTYVANWPEFKEFIEQKLDEMDQEGVIRQ